MSRWESGEGQLQAASAVQGVAVALRLLRHRSRRVADGWRAVFDGALMGAAGLTTWTLASSRRAAAAGPKTAVMLALLGTVAFEPALIYFRASFGWAVLLALGVRSPTRVGRPTVYENALPTEHVGIAGSAQPSSRARCQLGLEAPCSNPAPATEASEQSRTSEVRSAVTVWLCRS
jgi:hypothetical protein